MLHPSTARRQAIRLALAGLLVVALPASSAATAATRHALDTNLLANGSFEGSLDGWAASHATLALATDGYVGADAARLTADGIWTTFTLLDSPRVVIPSPAGVAYSAGGFLRSDTPGARVCLTLREDDASGAQVGSASSCTTSSASWTALPSTAYVVKAAGDELGVSVTESGAVAGDSFEADGLVLAQAPPETTIVSGPPAFSSSSDATFGFASNEPTATFVCSLDGAAYSPCSSPATYAGLADGQHTFSVAAVDATGMSDPTPATASWTIATPTSMLPNGSFEGTLSGWSSTNATVALAPDGVVGLDAAHVAAIGTPPAYSLHTWPHQFATTYARTAYTADGFVRSDGATHKVCLVLRELSPTGTGVGAGASCLLPTEAWQKFPTISYVAHADGDQLDLSISESSPSAGDSFEVDGLAVGENDPVIAAAGDIACDPAASDYNGGLGNGKDCMEQATADLLAAVSPAAVLPLGDNQYECGSLSAYQTSYDASWGRMKAITHPVPGNHDYYTSANTTPCDSTVAGSGYYGYFGAAAGDPSMGYYSYDLGPWHLIALNAQCVHVGGCNAGSPQERWLAADLAAHPYRCVLAYWHQPRFSSGQHGNDPSYTPFWNDLYTAGADVVLNGHDHDYERFAPQDPNGNLAPTNGVREFVVGTGGRNHDTFVTEAPNTEARNATTFGILTLRLRPTGYDWQFIPVTGGTFTDSGSSDCH